MATRNRRTQPAPKRLTKAGLAKAEPHYDPAAGWTYTETTKINGRILTPGVEVSVKGERGARFRFMYHVRTDKGVEWDDYVGGTKGVFQWRSFKPERIRRVHRDHKKMTTREALELQSTKRAAKKAAGQR